MEIDRRITSIWTVVVNEADVFNRVTDEGIQQESRLSAAPVKRGYSAAKGVQISDDDKAIFHRYYCAALAELSALLARRTRRVGGGIGNETDETTKMIKTTYFMPMTNNHEDSLIESLGAHCLEFLIARVMEKWYGHGSDFGGEREKGEIRHILHFRRYPIERPWSGL